MRADLQTLCDHAPRGRILARNMFLRERLLVRVAEFKLDPEDIDLNPHLQLCRIAELVVGDVVEEGFPEIDEEDVYLMWLTTHIFKMSGPPII